LTSIISCDATNYERWKPEKRFHGLIGVSVQIDDPSGFKQKYENATSKFFKKYKLKQEKKVHCSSDLCGKFFEKLGLGHEEFKDALESLVSELCDGLYVTVFYATCNTKKYPKVTVFGGDASMGKTKQVPTMEFMRDWLSQYYVYVSAWKLTKCLKTQNKNFLLDGFRGPITESWNELSRNNRVEIVNLGDECNAFVSAADLVARYIDEALGPLKITQENIENIELKSKEYHVHYCFHNDLADLVPLFEGLHSKTGRQINFTNYWKRPIVYILKEESGIIREDTDWLRKTPFFNAICDIAFDLDASIKFYNKDEDKLLTCGDKFIYYGPKGEEKAEEMKKITDGLGIDIEIIYSKDLLK
jgi:hypothetical protein